MRYDFVVADIMRTRANLRERTQLWETKYWWVKRIFFHQTIFIMINRTDLIRRHNLHPIFIIFMKLVKRHNLHPTIIILSKEQQLGFFPRGQLSGAITEVFHCNHCLYHCNLSHCCHHCHLCLCHHCIVTWFRHCCHRRQSIWILPSCHCHTYDNITR